MGDGTAVGLPPLPQGAQLINPGSGASGSAGLPPLPPGAQLVSGSSQPSAPSGMVPLSQSLADNSGGEGTYQMVGPNGHPLAVPHSKVSTAQQNGYNFGGEQHFNPWYLIPGSMLGQKRMISDDEARYNRDRVQAMGQDPNTRQVMRQSGVVGNELGFAREGARTAVGLHDLAGKVGIGAGQPEPGQPKSGIRQFAEEPHEGLDENMGAGAEGMGEFFTGEEVLGLMGKMKNGSEALKGASSLATMLDKYPSVAKYLRIGVDAVKQGMIAGGQTLVKTGGDVGAAAGSGAIAAGLTGAMGAGFNAVENAAARRATTVENVGGVETPIPAEVRNQTPTPQQQAGQQSIRNAAQDTLGHHLEEVNASRAVPPSPLALPARTGPFEFKLRGLPDIQDASERGSVVRGNPVLVRDGAAAPRALPAPQQQPHTFSIEQPRPVEGTEGQIAHSAGQAPRHAFEQPAYTTSSAPTRTAEFAPNGRVIAGPEGSNGADIRTQRAPEAQSDVARGGGVINTQDTAMARGNLDRLNQVINSEGFGRMPAAQQSDLLRARTNVQRQLAEAESRVTQPSTVEPDASDPFKGSGFRLEHQPAQVEPAVNPQARGSFGEMRTQDSNVARAHIQNLNDFIDHEDFAKLPAQQQQELLTARREAQQQMADYHEHVMQNIPGANKPTMEQINIPATVKKIGSFGEAADYLESTATKGYDLLNDVTGNRFNAVRNEMKDAWATYKGASGTEAQQMAEKSVDAAEQKMTDLLKGLRGIVDDKMLDGFNDAYRSAQGLRRISAAVDGSFIGNPLSSARSWEYRGFDGAKLMTNLSALQQKMGTAKLIRLMGEDNLNTLYQVAELNRTQVQRAQTGQAITQIAKYMMKPHISGAGIGAAAGYKATGDWKGAVGGAAIGSAIGAASTSVMRTILTNPKIAKQFIYALDYGARPEKYGPYLAEMIQKAMTDSTMEDRHAQQ